MAFIQWNESYSVGIAEIDKQHMRLVELINTLYEAMRLGKGNDAVDGILDELAGYTQTHFKLEEKHFDTYSYPGTVSHKDEHQKFIQEVSEFKKAFNERRIMLSVKVLNFLRDWLNHHILEIDKAYAPFLQGKGLK